MFYELYDWDHYTDEKEYHLINLNEVLQINRSNSTCSLRNDKTGQVTKYYKIAVYYTGRGNDWTFYYRSETERNIVYENLKQAMKDFKVLPEEPKRADIGNVLDGLKQTTSLLDEMLKNPGPINIPEVKLCE